MAALVRPELRQLQYAEDARQVVVCDPGVGQATRFTREVDQVDLAPIVESMPADGTTALPAWSGTRKRVIARSWRNGSPTSSVSR